MPVYMSVSMPVCLLIYLSICLSIFCLFVYLHTCLHFHLFIFLFIVCYLWRLYQCRFQLDVYTVVSFLFEPFFTSPDLTSYMTYRHRKNSYSAALLSFDSQQDHTARPECYIQETSDIRYSSDKNTHAGSERGLHASYITYSERQALLNSDRNRVKRLDWKNDDMAKAHESSELKAFCTARLCGR